MQIIGILSDNGKHLHSSLFVHNLLESTGMFSEEYKNYIGASWGTAQGGEEWQSRTPMA